MGGENSITTSGDYWVTTDTGSLLENHESPGLAVRDDIDEGQARTIGPRLDRGNPEGGEAQQGKSVRGHVVRFGPLRREVGYGTGSVPAWCVSLQRSPATHRQKREAYSMRWSSADRIAPRRGVGRGTTTPPAGAMRGNFGLPLLHLVECYLEIPYTPEATTLTLKYGRTRRAENSRQQNASKPCAMDFTADRRRKKHVRVR